MWTFDWRRGLGALGFALLPLGLACGYTELEPAESATRVRPGSTTVVEQDSGVLVRANADTWTRDREVEQQVIPVEIAVTNRTRSTVYFRRSDVSLVSGGAAVAALSLDRLRRLDDLETSVGLEPGVAAEEDGGDLGYYATSPGRVDEPRPGDEAVNASIPEGPIESGKELRGFVFFGEPPDDFDTVALRVVLRSAPEPDAPVAATVDIPFVVER